MLATVMNMQDHSTVLNKRLYGTAPWGGLWRMSRMCKRIVSEPTAAANRTSKDDATSARTGAAGARRTGCGGSWTEP